LISALRICIGIQSKAHLPLTSKLQIATALRLPKLGLGRD
jgi:hypothetical protein